MSESPLIELKNAEISHGISTESLAFSAEIALLVKGENAIRIDVSNSGRGGCNRYEPPLHKDYCAPFREAAGIWAEANGETFEVEDALVSSLLGKWQERQDAGSLGRDTWALVTDEDGGEGGLLAHGPFTQTEAAAFVAGVEYVNDGAVEVVGCVPGGHIPEGYAKHTHSLYKEPV